LSLALIDARHSLLEQSRSATEALHTTNADGFGVGWYSPHTETPGLFRDVRPAWNDSNFRDLAEHVLSPMFMAHVRAATGTSVQRTNCHPFRHEHWLFQHNGLIPEFARIRRELLCLVDADLFQEIQGTTDSEVLFHLALTLGLQDDPRGALGRTVAKVEEVLRSHDIAEDFHFSAAVADGDRLWAVRYASRGTPATLYYATDLDVLQGFDPSLAAIPSGSVVVVSEPLGDALHWDAVPPGALIEAGDGEVDVEPFQVGVVGN
jgi:glutamine amidotransferase